MILRTSYLSQHIQLRDQDLIKIVTEVYSVALKSTASIIFS